MKVQLVSLGAWCRPAHQIRVYTKKREVLESLASPFDWTITSFNALKACLKLKNSNELFCEGNAFVSHAKSGACRRTGLIFHHSVPPSFIRKLGNIKIGDALPKNDFVSRVLDESRSRFAYTLDQLKSLRNTQNEIVFIRWRRFGHPDKRFPAAFEGENKDTLFRELERFLGHNKFRLVIVESRIVPGVAELLEQPLIQFDVEDQLVFCILAERKGWNGDQSFNFKGDEHSWDSMLDEIMRHCDYSA